MNNIYVVKNKSLQIVSESIINPDVSVCLFNLIKGVYLFCPIIL